MDKIFTSPSISVLISWPNNAQNDENNSRLEEKQIRKNQFVHSRFSRKYDDWNWVVLRFVPRDVKQYLQNFNKKEQSISWKAVCFATHWFLYFLIPFLSAYLLSFTALFKQNFNKTRTIKRQSRTTKQNFNKKWTINFLKNSLRCHSLISTFSHSFSHRLFTVIYSALWVKSIA